MPNRRVRCSDERRVRRGMSGLRSDGGGPFIRRLPFRTILKQDCERDRPELHRMLDQLREGDVVVVWKLDRLSRSLKDVLHIMDRIGEVGAGFRSITEAIDTTTPAGRMMMQMIGSFAEFERAMIRERTSAGLAAARAEGRIGGRRKKLDPAKRREIAESVISGRKTGAEMARLYNISRPTVSRIVAAHRTAGP